MLKKGIAGLLVLAMLFTSLALMPSVKTSADGTQVVATDMTVVNIGDFVVLGPNLIPNGDFKDGLHLWSNSIPAIRTEIITGDINAPSGLPYIKITGGTYDSMGVS
ncbi:MAG: hypothetical protein WCL29_00085 [Pseudomonadota bacterium]